MIHDSPALWREADFRKSSFSTENGGACVEVARTDTWFGIRDSKYTDGPVLALNESQGRMFLASVKRHH